MFCWKGSWVQCNVHVRLLRFSLLSWFPLLGFCFSLFFLHSLCTKVKEYYLFLPVFSFPLSLWIVTHKPDMYHTWTAQYIKRNVQCINWSLKPDENQIALKRVWNYAQKGEGDDKEHFSFLSLSPSISMLLYLFVCTTLLCTAHNWLRSPCSLYSNMLFLNWFLDKKTTVCGDVHITMLWARLLHDQCSLIGLLYK